jgi:hypothetical protein
MTPHFHRNQICALATDGRVLGLAALLSQDRAATRPRPAVVNVGYWRERHLGLYPVACAPAPDGSESFGCNVPLMVRVHRGDPDSRRHLLRERPSRIVPAKGLAQIALPGRITLTNRYVWWRNVQDGKSKNACRGGLVRRVHLEGAGTGRDNREQNRWRPVS